MGRSVAAQDRAIAFLHDVLEQTATGPGELLAQGLTPSELGVLDLLTRAPGESYEAHALRIALASGPAGRAARRVKLADLDNHLRHARMPDSAPPYAWARLHVVAAQARRDESLREDAAAAGSRSVEQVVRARHAHGDTPDCTSAFRL